MKRLALAVLLSVALVTPAHAGVIDNLRMAYFHTVIWCVRVVVDQEVQLGPVTIFYSLKGVTAVDTRTDAPLWP